MTYPDESNGGSGRPKEIALYNPALLEIKSKVSSYDTVFLAEIMCCYCPIYQLAIILCLSPSEPRYHTNFLIVDIKKALKDC